MPTLLTESVRDATNLRVPSPLCWVGLGIVLEALEWLPSEDYGVHFPPSLRSDNLMGERASAHVTLIAHTT